jgi:biotin carboxyl carrier protein
MDYQFQIAEKLYQVKIESSAAHTFQAEIDGKQIEFQYNPISENSALLLAGDSSVMIYFASENHKKYVFVNGDQFEIEEITKKESIARSVKPHERRETENKISAPMPGRLLKLLVSENETVEVNQPLFIVESMKMENEVQSPIAGKVKKIHFEENALVSVGDPIVELEKEKEKSAE